VGHVIGSIPTAGGYPVNTYVIRARKPKRLPVVMTRDEVKAVLSNLTGDKWLMASMMYGAGLRL